MDDAEGPLLDSCLAQHLHRDNVVGLAGSCCREKGTTILAAVSVALHDIGIWEAFVVDQMS